MFILLFFIGTTSHFVAALAFFAFALGVAFSFFAFALASAFLAFAFA